MVKPAQNSVTIGRRVQLTSDAGDGVTPGGARAVLADRDHAVSDARVDVDGIVPIGVFTWRSGSGRAIARIGQDRLARDLADPSPGHVVVGADLHIVGVGAPPEVLMKVNRLMSKLVYQLAPLLGIHGEMSMEKTAFGKELFNAFTRAVMLVPACAAVQGWVSPPPVYWYQSGSISKIMGRPPRQAAKPVELLVYWVRISAQSWVMYCEP